MATEQVGVQFKQFLIYSQKTNLDLFGQIFFVAGTLYTKYLVEIFVQCTRTGPRCPGVMILGTVPQVYL